MFPLFIIDSSRQHGRGEECDYLYCTAHDCEFIAKVELIEEKEFKLTYNKNDKKTIYSDVRNELRIRIQVIQIYEADEARLQTLLKKALKEVLERRQSNVIGDKITDSDVVLLISTIIEQLKEQIALHPNSPANYILQLRIFSKILQDYKK